MIRSGRHTRKHREASRTIPSGGQMVAKAFADGLASHPGFSRVCSPRTQVCPRPSRAAGASGGRRASSGGRKR
jgi:hypothetical protein